MSPAIRLRLYRGLFIIPLLFLGMMIYVVVQDFSWSLCLAGLCVMGSLLGIYHCGLKPIILNGPPPSLIPMTVEPEIRRAMAWLGVFCGLLVVTLAAFFLV